MKTNDINDIPEISDLRLLDTDVDAEWARFRQSVGMQEPKIFRLNTFLKVAASVVIVAGLGILAWNSLSKPHSDTFVASNTAVEATVEHSTQISLNRNSSVVCTDVQDGIYKVELDGEAYFNVEKNPERSFQIHTDDITVIVHGTSFDVCEQDDRTVVTVTSGNVEVRNNATGQAVTDITKYKQLVCTKDGKMSVSDIKDYNDIAWKLRNFRFDGARLSDVMGKLSKAYNFDYKFLSPGIQDYTLTGTFDNQSLESVLSVIGQTLDVKISQPDSGKVLIGE